MIADYQMDLLNPLTEKSAPILNGMTDYNPVLYLENDDF